MNIEKTDQLQFTQTKIFNDATKEMESKSQTGLKYPQCKNDKAFSSRFYKEPPQLSNN